MCKVIIRGVIVMRCDITGYPGPHCDSCHEDSDEYNVQGCTVEVMIDGELTEIEVCCKAQIWYNEQQVKANGGA